MKEMNRRTFLKASAAAALTLAAGNVMSACGKGSDKASLILATGGPAGTYYAVGGAMATVLNAKLEKSSLTVTSTGASMANIQLVDGGDAALAIVQNDVMSYAANGTNLFAEQGAITSFKTVCGLYAETCQVVCNENIKSFEDLKGKRVVVGDAGSGTEFNAKQILSAYGITYDDIEVMYGSFANMADQIKDGLIDAGFVTAGAPTNAVTELSTVKTINILEIDDAHADALIKDYPFYSKITIPAGTYNGLDKDIQTVTVKATLICSAKLADDVVYELIQALFDNRDALIVGHGKFNEMTLENAVDGIDVAFHPGAEKYLKDHNAL